MYRQNAQNKTPDEEENSERKIKKRTFRGQRPLHHIHEHPRASIETYAKAHSYPLHYARFTWIMVPWVCGSMAPSLPRGGVGHTYLPLASLETAPCRYHQNSTDELARPPETACISSLSCIFHHGITARMAHPYGTPRHSSSPHLAGPAAYQSSSATLLLCLLASIACREAGDGRCSLRRPVSDHVPPPSPNMPESTRENGLCIHQSPPRATSDQQSGMLLLRCRYVDGGCVRSRMAVQLQHVNAYQVYHSA